MENSKPYFELVDGNRSIRWSKWKEQKHAWIITDNKGLKRFLSFSDEDHPEKASEWKYLPYGKNTKTEDMKSATDLQVQIIRE